MRTTHILMIVLIAIGAIVGSTFATISYLDGVESNSTEESSPIASAGDSATPNSSDPRVNDFARFRLAVLDAVKRRDAKFINDLVTIKTQWNFGGTSNFYSSNIEDAQSIFWQYMEKAVTSGCTIELDAKVTDKEEEFEVWVCPETSGKAIYDPDWQDEVAILGKNVNVRSEPGTNASVLAVLSKEVIKFDRETFNNLVERMQGSVNYSDGWTPVVLSSGKKGWVQNRFVYYEPRDYRVSFIRYDGEWKLRYFLRGKGN